MMDKKRRRVVVVCPNNVEDTELIVPIDIWKRASFIVDIIFYDTKNSIMLNYSNLKLTGQNSIKNMNMIQYDAIYMPGGPGYKNYLNFSSIEKGEPESKLHKTLKKFFDDEARWIVALCAAPIPLMYILEKERTEGLLFTCYKDNELIGEFKPQWLNKKVVVDKNVITGQNMGCSYDVALALIEALDGKQAADEMAKKLLIDYPGMREYKHLVEN